MCSISKDFSKLNDLEVSLSSQVWALNSTTFHYIDM